MVITDYAATLVDNSAYNIGINLLDVPSDATAACIDTASRTEVCTCGVASCLTHPALACARRCVACKLDWEDIARTGDLTAVDPACQNQFPVVIGSDIVYRKEDVELIAKVLRCVLAPDGSCLPHPFTAIAQ